MGDTLGLGELKAAVAGSAAAFRSVTELQPVGGQGDKVFPATYSGGVYAAERRRLGDQIVDCILLDSVQSQANRAEEALKDALMQEKLNLPIIEVSFEDANEHFLSPLPSLTSLDVPHRLADAILRDSELADGTRFSKSEYAKRWRRSNLWDATAVYELCPTSLVFGMWGSPEKPGGLGAKFERAYVSEIVAVDVVNDSQRTEREAESARTTILGKRAGFRIDPLNCSNCVEIRKDDGGTYSVGMSRDKDGNPVKAREKMRPSNINHGNIPFDSANSGIRFRYAEQTTVISLGVLRKLCFPMHVADGHEANVACRTVLAALGLCAGVLASESNTNLRSRCDLWPTADRKWELLEKPGQSPREFAITGEQAIALLKEAVAKAEEQGVKWNTDKILLHPSKELSDLIRLSQEAAAAEKGEGESK